MSDNNNEINDGWGFESFLGTVYHFTHIPKSKADKLSRRKRWTYVVETINWTIASGDTDQVHHNHYYAQGLPDAIALANRLEISSLEVAEEVICIRRAKEEEDNLYNKLFWHFQNLMPKELSENEALSLLDADLFGGKIQE